MPAPPHARVSACPSSPAHKEDLCLPCPLEGLVAESTAASLLLNWMTSVILGAHLNDFWPKYCWFSCLRRCDHGNVHRQVASWEPSSTSLCRSTAGAPATRALGTSKSAGKAGQLCRWACVGTAVSCRGACRACPACNAVEDERRSCRSASGALATPALWGHAEGKGALRAKCEVRLKCGVRLRSVNAWTLKA